MKDPWTEADPQAGDFDADLAQIDSRFLEAHEGKPEAKLRVLVSVEGEHVARLKRLAEARASKPGDRVADLVRAADGSIA